MKSITVILAALLLASGLIVSAGVQETDAAACSGSVTSLSRSGTNYVATGWANCSGYLRISKTGSWSSTDGSSPFWASINMGVCLVNGGPKWVSAYVVSGGNVVSARSVQVCW